MRLAQCALLQREREHDPADRYSDSQKREENKNAVAELFARSVFRNEREHDGH